MKKYRFYKNELGWSIDIPKFPFNKAWLAMIAGADDLLDILSEGNDEVYLEIGTKKVDNYTDVLLRTTKLGLLNGAIYKTESINIPFEDLGKNSLWLCPATLWVFWRYPEKIYFRVLKS